MSSKVIVYSDGASRGNPGPAAIGGIIMNGSGETLEKFSEFIGEATNNQAEYLAAVESLRRASKFTDDEVELRTDSELVVKQLKGEYRVKNENLLKLLEEFNSIRKKFKKVEIIHVSREQNQVADALCNRALDMALRKRETARGNFSVSVLSKFDCAHSLLNYEGKCSSLHGHSYKVEVSVSGVHLKDGILVDIVDLKRTVKEVLDQFDHKYLNELAYFKDRSPTAENICIVIAEMVQKKLPPHVKLEYVKVFESEDSFVTYRPYAG